MSNSYTPPDRSTYDPGWNDPPKMGTSVPAANKPRTSLNKRIAFPMQSSGSASSSNVKTTAEGLPLPFSTAKYQPPPMNPTPLPDANVLTPPVVPLPPPASIVPSAPVETIQTQLSTAIGTAAAKQLCTSTFNRLIDAMDTDSNAGKVSEIRKRLDILYQMWNDDKLTESVQQNLYQLAKALEDNDTAVAMEQHRILVTQHISVSTQWATALRQLILSLSPDLKDDSQNTAAVVDAEPVQFVDVSSKQDVMDQIPTIPIDSNSQPAVNPPIAQQATESSNSVTSSNDISANSSESKPKFGRILHI